MTLPERLSDLPMRVAALLILLPAIVSAQDVEIRPRLTAGDEFRLEVTRVRQNTRPPTNVTSRTPVTVRVISTAPDGTVLDWTPGDTAFGDPQVARDPVVATMARAVSGIRFRLMLNGDGEFTRLTNEAEVTPKLQAVLDAMLQLIAQALPADERKTFDAALRRILSPAALLAGATTDAQIYFALNGAALAQDETVEAQIQAASPVGGGTIPAAFRVRMDSVTAQSASLSTTTTYDAAAVRSVTAALAQQVGKPIPPEELAKIPPIEMTDEGTYLFDRALGLMREVAINRRVAGGGAQRFDRWVIRLVTAPSR